jgi:hypothetical protein
MILYNVTVNIEDDIHLEWIEWMRSTHVPDVMQTGCFVKNKILKISDPVQDGHTYSFQYFAESMDRLREYQTKFANDLQADHEKRYANKFVAFRTILEVIEENKNSQ